MTTTVPPEDKTGAYQLQAEITNLQNQTDPSNEYLPGFTTRAVPFDLDLLNRRQIDLVNSLISSGRLSAAAILSTISFSSNSPLVAQVANMQTLVTSSVGTAPCTGYTDTLLRLQNQLVQELMNSGAMTAATILSTMTYIGGAAQ